MKRMITLNVNNREYDLVIPVNLTLTQVLRENLKLTGTKQGCSVGDCGACTVLMNGEPVNSCLVLAVEAEGYRIQTIEGVAEEGKLHPVQEAFVEKGGIQCGFCSPGMILTAKALLDKNPKPNETEIREALSGNLCRCTGYQKIVESIQEAAERKGGN